MPFSPQTLEEKPYNLCVNCSHIGKLCDGPNFLAMDMPRLSEWCRLRKDYLHNQNPKWTNAHIAEQSDVSKVSVDRFLSGNIDDIKISTIARILKVLVNGTWGQYPCAMAAITEQNATNAENPKLVKRAEETAAECQRLRAMLNSLNAEHKTDLAEVRADDQRKIDYLKDQIKFKDSQLTVKDDLLAQRYDFLKQRNRVILVLALLLGLSVLVIIAALVIDATDPTRGFFWFHALGG